MTYNIHVYVIDLQYTCTFICDPVPCIHNRIVNVFYTGFTGANAESGQDVAFLGDGIDGPMVDTGLLI